MFRFILKKITENLKLNQIGMKTQLVTKALTRAEMRKITGGGGIDDGSCIPQNDRDRECLLGGAITSCLEIPCCCDFYCSSEFDGEGFVNVCRAI